MKTMMNLSRYYMNTLFIMHMKNVGAFVSLNDMTVYLCKLNLEIKETLACPVV